MYAYSMWEKTKSIHPVKKASTDFPYKKNVKKKFFSTIFFYPSLKVQARVSDMERTALIPSLVLQSFIILFDTQAKLLTKVYILPLTFLL